MYLFQTRQLLNIQRHLQTWSKNYEIAIFTNILQTKNACYTAFHDIVGILARFFDYTANVGSFIILKPSNPYEKESMRSHAGACDDRPDMRGMRSEAVHAGHAVAGGLMKQFAVTSGHVPTPLRLKIYWKIIFLAYSLGFASVSKDSFERFDIYLDPRDRIDFLSRKRHNLQMWGCSSYLHNSA